MTGKVNGKVTGKVTGDDGGGASGRVRRWRRWWWWNDGRTVVVALAVVGQRADFYHPSLWSASSKSYACCGGTRRCTSRQSGGCRPATWTPSTVPMGLNFSHFHSSSSSSSAAHHHHHHHQQQQQQRQIAEPGKR